ncbi:hypothetical protein BJX66DRAFT_305854 [Aspergillus keveii]|uniref:Proteophosphoglycan ppg4 n=1 Tax=Aspergillus keveii TaxID=714993 RepID=A0ABR4G3I4_9EURO
MPQHLPLEILSQILTTAATSLLISGLDYEDDGKPAWSRDSNAYRARRDGRRHAFELRLVSTLVRDIVDPVLFREIESPSDGAVKVLAEMMVSRPGVAGRVERFGFGEEEESASDEEDSEEEESEEDPRNDDDEPDSDAENQRERKQPPPPAPPAVKQPKPLAIAAEQLIQKFKTNATTYARALEENNLTWLTRSNRKTRPWLLLLYLPNLRHLTLTARTDTFANMSLFLRLPRLEHLEFSVLAPGPDFRTQENYASPTEMLEGIISSTENLRYLKFEDGIGTVFQPVEHDVTRVKDVLERAGCADRLEYLSLVFSNNHERDWREEQEFSYLEGSFGSLRHFTKLRGLAMQLDALLGKPDEDPDLLCDVLPEQLEHFTGISMQDYSQPDEAETLWEEEYLIPQFRDLALAATGSGLDEEGADGDGENGGKMLRFPNLTSVKMHRHRKDRFYTSIEAQMWAGYADDDPSGVLSDSRIYFGWVRGPRVVAPGPD